MLGSGKLGYGMARRLGLGKFWRGKLRLGGQGMVSSGAVSFGRVRHGGSGGAGYVSERRGPAWRVRRSRRVTLRLAGSVLVRSG
jgi:hypothetical protein